MVYRNGKDPREIALRVCREIKAHVEEYLNFRGHMALARNVEHVGYDLDQVYAALQRADKMVNALKDLRFIMDLVPGPVHEPGQVLAFGRECRSAIPGQQFVPPSSAWQCPHCHEIFWMEPRYKPDECPTCKRRLG
jgi:hypothetical protein